MQEHLAEFRARRAELADDLDRVESILQRGAERARAEARKTLTAARRGLGLE